MKYTQEQLEAFKQLDEISMGFLCPKLSSHPLFKELQKSFNDGDLMKMDEWITNADYYRRMQPKTLWRDPLDRAEQNVHNKRSKVIELLLKDPKEDTIKKVMDAMNNYNSSESHYFSLKRETLLNSLLGKNNAK